MAEIGDLTPKELTYKHVRQFLVNELGITREDVREEMRRFVSGTVEKYLASYAFSERIDLIIESKINAALSVYRNDKSQALTVMIKNQVEAELKKQAKDFVENRLLLSVKAEYRQATEDMI